MSRVKGKILGVGINSKSYPTCETPSYKILREYDMWRAMLVRTNDETFKEDNVSYEKSTVSDDWLDYSNFYDWYDLCSYKERDWQLDKDVLFKGNKLYSPQTCCLVPREINNLLISRRNDRGDYPIGVNLHASTGRFQASCSNGSLGRKYLGLFDKAEDAFQAFKTFKESLIKQKAEKYKDMLRVDVYSALMSYEVEIDD